MKPIRIALTKGRLEEKSIEMFEQLGYDCSEVRNKGRRLILPVKNANIEIVLAKAADSDHLCGKRRLRFGRGGERHHHGSRRYILRSG